MTAMFRMPLRKRGQLFPLVHFKNVRIGLTALFSLSSLLVVGQFDSTYYVSYDRMITSRFYFSQKYTIFNVHLGDGVSLNFRPNTTLNMGVGATYKSFTLNLAYGFPFLNQDQEKGKTKYLDLQMHGYGRKTVIEAVGQFYHGFYLDNAEVTSKLGHYWVRPDVSVYEIGGSFQYIFNYRRFSYRAAFLQNEWQKKSAGSFLVGAEAYVGKLKSDSTIVPQLYRSKFAPNEGNVNELRFVMGGINIGYAYTLVIRKHYFISGTFSTSAAYTEYVTESVVGSKRGNSFTPNTILKLYAGYNSEKWAISATFVNNHINIGSRFDQRYADINTGNYRLNFVYRFEPGPKTKKFLKVLDRGK